MRKTILIGFANNLTILTIFKTSQCTGELCQKMKKIVFALAVVSMFSFVACNTPKPNRPVENAVIEHFCQNEEVYDVEAFVVDTLRAYGVKFTKVNAMVSLDGKEYVKTVRYVVPSLEVVSSIDTAIARCYADSVRRAELRARIDVM